MTDHPSLDPLERIGQLLYREAALAYPRSKRTFVEDRVRAFMEGAGLKDEHELLGRLPVEPALRTALIEALTIHETRFFRIPAQFEALATLLPKLAERRRRSPLDRPVLRLWVAACSTGEEAYSLAMRVLDLHPIDWRAEILATDLSGAVLRHARRGRFPIDRLEHLPPGFRERYFVERGGELEIVPEVKALVRFEQHNLKDPAPPGAWDLVFCRNVMIYFDNPFRAELLERLYRALTPGGYLFVGEAETLHLVPHRFKTCEAGAALFYQRPLVESS